MIIGVDIRPLMEKEPSGVSQYLFNLLDNLFKIDRVNQYKLFYNSFRPVSLPAWQYPNVRFYGFRWPNKLLNFSFRFFSRPWVDRLLGGVDVFWLPNLSFIALSPEVKKVATVHDLSFELYPEFLSGWRELWHWVINPRRFFRQADKLIAVSEATRRDLAAVYGTPGGRVELVYSGVRQLESQRVRELESQGGLPEKFILTLGTREPRKNLIGVIKAWEKVKLESGD
ncbi:MAG: glycosyltransferase [Patescibacteria group bacterium]